MIIEFSEEFAKLNTLGQGAKNSSWDLLFQISACVVYVPSKQHAKYNHAVHYLMIIQNKNVCDKCFFVATGHVQIV